jgi:hypothetical protein
MNPFNIPLMNNLNLQPIKLCAYKQKRNLILYIQLLVILKSDASIKNSGSL